MTPIIDCPLAAFRLAMTGQNQEPALAERHAVLCECLLQGRSAFGPTPCSLASSAAGTSASRLSRVYPAAVSARVAGAPILPGRPASRDVMYRIAPVPGHMSRREDLRHPGRRSAPAHAPPHLRHDHARRRSGLARRAGDRKGTPQASNAEPKILQIATAATARRTERRPSAPLVCRG